MDELQRIRVNDFDMGYLDDGVGSPVVFVHGSITDHRTWLPHRQALAPHCRMLCPDLRYFGTAPWPDDGRNFSVQTHAGDLAAFIRERVTGPVTLVGWSLGGTVSILTALQDPDLVGAMFLYEPSLATFLTDPQEVAAAAEDRERAFREGTALVDRGELEAAVPALVDGLNGPGVFDRLTPAARSMFLDNARTLSLSGRMPRPPAISAERLRALEMPVKVVVGAQTREFFRIVGRKAAELVPSASFQSIDGAVHLWPSLEPHAFSEVVHDFLSGEGRVAPTRDGPDAA